MAERRPRLPLPTRHEARRRAGERLLGRLVDELGCSWDRKALRRVVTLIEKGCRPGVRSMVLPGNQGRWSVVDGKLSFLAPGYKAVQHKPATQVGKVVAQVEKKGGLLLADSLRVAFLLGDEALEASGGGQGRGSGWGTSETLLGALSGATSLQDVPAKYRKKVVSVPFRVPGGLELTEYQKLGVAYLWHRKLRAYVADAMGLGKTIEAIVGIATAGPKVLPAAVVCPSSVTLNWKAEIEKWGPDLRPVVLGGGVVPRAHGREVYITTWSSLHRYARALHKVGVKTLVCDEAQAIKNPKSRRSRAARALAVRVPCVLLLSGTPVENRVEELWHPLHLLEPDTWPDAQTFEESVVGKKQKVKAIGEDGLVIVTERQADPTQAVAEILPRLMLRRTKTQVLDQLPAKRRVFLAVDLPKAARAAYDRTAEEIEAYLAAKARELRLDLAAKEYQRLVGDGKPEELALLEASVLGSRAAVSVPAEAVSKLGILRQLVGKAKVGVAVQWVLERPPEPLLVFTEHRAVIDLLAKKLSKIRRVASIQGSTPNGKRQQIVEAFQRGELDVIVATRALATGVTLTRASRVLFVERWWLPTVEEQGEDRVHRLGQTEAVEVYYLMARGTVDQHVSEIVDRKRVLVDRIMGAEDVTADDADDEAGLHDGQAAASVGASLARQVAERMASVGNTEVTVEDLRAWLASGRSAPAKRKGRKKAKPRTKEARSARRGALRARASRRMDDSE